MHTGIIRVSTSVFALLFAIGCGSAAVRERASVPQHQWSEADWYAEAIDQAFESYESEVAQATSVEYQSQAEADAVARTVTRRFDAHLASALNQYGLTIHGLQVFGNYHPEFVEQQTAVNQPRMQQIYQTTAMITLVRTREVVLADFDMPDAVESGEQIAAR